jgi:hypothetical protein
VRCERRQSAYDFAELQVVLDVARVKLLAVQDNLAEVLQLDCSLYSHQGCLFLCSGAAAEDCHCCPELLLTFL